MFGTFVVEETVFAETKDVKNGQKILPTGLRVPRFGAKFDKVGKLLLPRLSHKGGNGTPFSVLV